MVALLSFAAYGSDDGYIFATHLERTWKHVWDDNVHAASVVGYTFSPEWLTNGNVVLYAESWPDTTEEILVTDVIGDTRHTKYIHG